MTSVFSSNPWVWLAAFWTLSLFTVAFADNPIYRFSESVYIGVSAGYMVTANWFNWIRPNAQAIINGRYLLIVPFILGLLVYTRYFKPIAWMSRLAIAFNLGVGSGLILSRDFRSLFLLQVTATFRALNTIPSNWVLVFGTVASLIYFLFTIEQRGLLGYAGRTGRLVMMIALGAAFGSTVMARVSLFLGRVQFLLMEWMLVVK